MTLKDLKRKEEKLLKRGIIHKKSVKLFRGLKNAKRS
jgi:hypothetical protein